ncbi:MAG TPA: ABC transporter ATP-binding protein [Verrucomicrobiae bacterium]|nr:ABC transporter ATP-binding protein [Verrucomicrobiae bacterium]
MIRRLFPYCQTARKETAIGGGILFFATFVDLLQPWPIKWLVDYVFGNHAPPSWLTSIWPAFATKNVAGGITVVCVSILALALVHRLGITIGHFFLVRAGARVVQQLRCHACEHLHRLSLAYHDRTKVGDSLYRVAYDSHAAQSLLNGALVPAVTGALVLTGAVIVMVQINALLTLVTMAVAPLFFLIIRGFGRRLDEQSRRYHESESALVSTVQESLSSIRAIQAFTLEPETGQRFRGHSEKSLDANQRMTRTQLTYSACAGLAVSLGTAAVVWVASHQVMAGRLSLGDILIFLAYLGMLYQPMSTFSQSASVVQSANAQLRRVFEIIDAVPDIKERPHAITLPSVRGGIQFRNVSFRYHQESPVLNGVDLNIEPGQVLAVVGRTGAGKTTLASLLLRFYDPTDGAILLDGHDLRDLKLPWLRQQVSVVLQDPILFSSTVAENIAYGKPGASLEDIRKAARQAQADEFIQALPKGYDTILGERGVNLSGGQRQRLSIARAFLKNAPILILDEPTAALDTHTEEALLACLHDLMRGRTAFVIAHRLSTVRHADRIIVLEKGTIIESGNHEELLSRNSTYSKMYRSQWGNRPAAEAMSLAHA